MELPLLVLQLLPPPLLLLLLTRHQYVLHAGSVCTGFAQQFLLGSMRCM